MPRGENLGEKVSARPLVRHVHPRGKFPCLDGHLFLCVHLPYVVRFHIVLAFRFRLPFFGAIGARRSPPMLYRSFARRGPALPNHQTMDIGRATLATPQFINPVFDALPIYRAATASAPTGQKPCFPIFFVGLVNFPCAQHRNWIAQFLHNLRVGFSALAFSDDFFAVVVWNCFSHIQQPCTFCNYASLSMNIYSFNSVQKYTVLPRTAQGSTIQERPDFVTHSNQFAAPLRSMFIPLVRKKA